MTDNEQTAQESAVFINWVDEGEGLWEAVWQRGDEHMSVMGSRTDCLEWAAAQVADAYYLFTGDKFAPWSPPDGE